MITELVQQLSPKGELPAHDTPRELLLVIEARDNAIKSLSAIEEMSIASLENFRAVNSCLARCIRFSQNYVSSVSFTRDKLRDTAGDFVKQLEEHSRSLNINYQDTQGSILPVQDSESFRVALLAIDLYEADRGDRQQSTTRHVPHSNEALETTYSPNSLYLNLPPAHSIDVSVLAETLTTMIRDESLAHEIATTFREKAHRFQINLPVVQSLLQVNSETMAILLQYWTLQELLDVTASSSPHKIPSSLLTKILTTTDQYIRAPTEALGFIRDLGGYIAQLAPREQYVPIISPYLSPDNFLDRAGLERARELLGTLRSGTVPPAVTNRIIAEAAIETLLAPYTQKSKESAVLLVYSFGQQREPRTSCLPMATLLRGKVQRHADLSHLHLTSSNKRTDWLDSTLAATCENLEELGLLKIQRPKLSANISLADALELVTASLAENPRSIPPAVWTLVVNFLEAAGKPDSEMTELIKRISILKTTGSTKQRTSVGSPSKQKNKACWRDVFTAFAELAHLLRDLDPNEKQHTIKRHLGRITTQLSTVNKLLAGLGASDQTGALPESNARAEQLLKTIKPPSKVDRSSLAEYRALAEAALTGVQNLFASAEEPSEV